VGAAFFTQLGWSPANDRESAQHFAEILATACPLGAQIITFTTSTWPPAQSRIAFYIGQLIVLLATIGLALVVLTLTMLTFNRCVGRAPERPRRAPRPPRPTELIAPRPVDPRHALSSRPVGVT